MNFLSLNDVLEEIASFVNDCLGPLGQDGMSAAKLVTYFRDLLIQLIAILVMFLLVRKFLWKPITNMLETKKDAIDKELTEAEELKVQAQQYELTLKKELEKAQEEVKTIIASAEHEANQRREQIIQEAKLEAEKRLANTDESIQNEIKNKQAEIRQMIVETAFLAASKIVEKEVDKDKYLSVVNSIIEGAAK